MRVALESTVISHGLPWPVNLESARACERAVRDEGAEPLTVAVVDGEPRVGLGDDELVELATRTDVAKVTLQNLGATVATGGWGATTVAATARLAERAGVRVFATGGIGGAHRHAERSFDVSADLTALGTIPIVVVASGAKSILDLPRTLEVLETLGVPVLGYGTDVFPAFYADASESHGPGTDAPLPVTARVETPEEVARIAAGHWTHGGRTAVLVAVPCPLHAAVPAAEIAAAVEEALGAADRAGVSGARLTPFLLAHVAERTGGRALIANLALLENNARVAARIAVAMAANDRSDRR